MAATLLSFNTFSAPSFFSGSSMQKVMSWNSRRRYIRFMVTNSGSSATHGAHHDAQTLITKSFFVSFFASVLGIPGGPLKVFAIILGILGFIIQYVAWTVGFGALLLTRFGTRYYWGESTGPAPTSPPATGGPEYPTPPTEGVTPAIPA